MNSPAIVSDALLVLMFTLQHDPHSISPLSVVLPAPPIMADELPLLIVSSPTESRRPLQKGDGEAENRKSELEYGPHEREGLGRD